MVRKIHLGTDSAILDYLEARLTVVKEAAIARNKDNKSTVLRLRLATLQQLYSVFTPLNHDDFWTTWIWASRYRPPFSDIASAMS